MTAESAIDAYLRRCERRIPGFVQRHYRYPGAWRTNRHALSWDLVRAPVNLFWAPCYVAALVLSVATRRVGAVAFSRRLARNPAGMRTCTQRYLMERIERELLGLSHSRMNEEQTRLVAQTLERYGSTRTAGADITNSVGSTVFGALALKQFTPGGIAIGLMLGGWLARRAAEADFFLGDTLGRWYYDWLPPTPSTTESLMGVAVVLTSLAVIAALSGLLTDPLQVHLGIHERRLRRMVQHLGKDLLEAGTVSYHPPDPYLARVMDAVDAIRGPLG